MNKEKFKEVAIMGVVCLVVFIILGSILLLMIGAFYDLVKKDIECNDAGYDGGTFTNIEIGYVKCYSYVYEDHVRIEVSEIMEYSSWFRGSPNSEYQEQKGVKSTNNK